MNVGRGPELLTNEPYPVARRSATCSAFPNGAGGGAASSVQRRDPPIRERSAGPRRPARRRLPRRRRHRRRRVPRRPAREAGAGRGPGRHRQDRAGQGGRRDHRRPADPPAVLRGPRRVQGALRVELQEAAAAHPGRPRARARLGDGRGRHLLRASSCSPGRCSRRSAPTSRSCCSSTRSTASRSRPRRCCSRSSPTTRCRSPSSARSTAKQIPLVFLTSNNTRELSEALKRRCLYLHIDYPDLEREKEIVLAKVPEIDDNLADQIARVVRSIRQLDLKKAPSISETIDWARTLLLPRRRRRSTPERAERDAARAAQVPDRHRQGAQGAREYLGRLPTDRPTGCRYRRSRRVSLGTPDNAVDRRGRPSAVRAPGASWRAVGWSRCRGVYAGRCASADPPRWPP